METENTVPLVPSNHEVKIIDRREIYITGVKKISSFATPSYNKRQTAMASIEELKTFK